MSVLAAVPTFVHLRLHTEYSLVDGTIRLERPEAITGSDKEKERKRHLEPRFMPLAEQARALGFPAIAITDLANVFAMVKFYKSIEKQGIKPIVGVDLHCEERKPGEGAGLLTLLVQNEIGYRNLVKLLSRAYTEGQASGAPRLKHAWLEGHTAGLIALLGPRSDVGRQLLGAQASTADALLAQWRAGFGDRLYLELNRCGRPDDEPHLRAAVRLARRSGTPVVATNDVRFLRAGDFDAHEARVCIAQGYTLDNERRPKLTSAEQWLKPAADMAKLFADIPEALANSVEIAKRCTLTLSFKDKYLPQFPVPDGHTTASWLRQQSLEGLQRRRAGGGLAIGPGRPWETYLQRLEFELGTIEKMGFPGYFLVVADFIAWGKCNGVPVGPGRGSGAGSLVAYALGITDLDPLPYDLLFERFLNPDRVSLPDFDVDFCMDGRDRVIDYVKDKYGRDRVGQIITYGTMAARAVVRDAARVLGHPYGLGDRIAKMIPGGPQGLTLGEALDEVPELKTACRNEEEVKAVVDMGLQLEGLTRSVGMHAAGTVIAPRELTDFTPLYCEPGGGGLVTQFDMKDVEEVGLVKFDFLGLKTLTIIEEAVQRINRKHGNGAAAALEILKIPLDDKPTYQLYASGNTTAVFQMESGGMQRASIDLKPDTFEDIIALISLYRPGPMDNIPTFVANKKSGRHSYKHPAMEAALKPTYGIFVYQEQVMQVARELAGYTLGQADLLRRAMGKKIASEMAQQRDVFVKGAVAKTGMKEALAGEIFDDIAKFAEYGFNKSHAAAYALVSYQTAWLKTHYPADFMASVLSCEMNNTDTVVMMFDECVRMKLKVLAPDVNRSGLRFEVTGEREILYGLGAIKGAGEGALANLLEERAKNGPFKDLFDLCRRIDTRKTNKKVLEALIGSGACDALGPNRATLMKQLPRAMAASEQTQSSAGAGQSDMFGLSTAVVAGPAEAAEPEWPEGEKLRLEKETLGLYFSGHPIEIHRALLKQVCSGTLKELIANARGPVLLGAWVVAMRRFGKRLVMTLDDRTAQVECVMGEEFLENRVPPRSDTLVLVQGKLAPDEFRGGWRVFPNELMDLEQAQARYAQRVLLKFEGPPAMPRLMQSLQALRDPQGCPVTVQYLNGIAQATIDLGADWRIRVQDSGLAPLRQLLGESNVRVQYRRAAALAEAE